MSKQGLLLLLHLSPPINGVTVINDQIIKMKRLDEIFDHVNIVPLRYSKKISDIESFHINKIIIFIRTFYNVFSKKSSGKGGIVLFSLSPKGCAFVRDFLLVLLLVFYKAKIIFHIHGFGFKKYSSNFLFRFLYKKVFKSGVVILPSIELINDIEDFVNRERILILNNGIPNLYNNNQINISMKKKLLRKKPQILFFSTMMKSKGPLILLKALSLIKAEKLNFEAVFAGEFYSDLTEDGFRMEVKKNDLKDIKYVGPLYGNKKKKIFLESDIFIFPTLNEAFGLVAIEAMSAGIPVIASKEGGLNSIILHNETGFLFKKGDSIELAYYIKKLILNPNIRESFGIAGRDRYKKLYSLDIFENNLLGILNFCKNNN